MKQKIVIIVLVVTLLVGVGFLCFRLINDKNGSNNDTQGINKPEQSTISTYSTTLSKEDKVLNNIYSNDKISKDYRDLRKLPKDYTIDDAAKDNCFTVGAMVHNEYLYDEFMDNCNNKKNAFIRVGQYTTEGDLILYDIVYDADSKDSNKFTLVTDGTRDKFGGDLYKNIFVKKYEYIGEYEYEKHLYWILYNGELNDETFYSENVFLITTIS